MCVVIIQQGSKYPNDGHFFKDSFQKLNQNGEKPRHVKHSQMESISILVPIKSRNWLKLEYYIILYYINRFIGIELEYWIHWDGAMVPYLSSGATVHVKKFMEVSCSS